jgi:hypothetical protein
MKEFSSYGPQELLQDEVPPEAAGSGNQMAYRMSTLSEPDFAASTHSDQSKIRAFGLNPSTQRLNAPGDQPVPWFIDIEAHSTGAGHTVMETGLRIF